MFEIEGNEPYTDVAQTLEKEGGIGVLEPLSEKEIRDKSGKFAKGHPVLPGAGRPPVDKTPDIRAAIWKRYSIDEVLARLDKAYEIALELRSARGIVAAVTPILEYGLGKPIQQVVHEAGRTELLEQLFEVKDTPLLPPPTEITAPALLTATTALLTDVQHNNE